MIEFKFNKIKFNHQIFLIDKINQTSLSLDEKKYYQNNAEKDEATKITALDDVKWVVKSNKKHTDSKEYFRLQGASIQKKLKKSTSISINNITKNEYAIAFLEGFLLSHYQFNQLKSKKEDIHIKVFCSNLDRKVIEQTQKTAATVHWVRDMVNYPVSHLNAQQLCDHIEKYTQKAGCQVENFEYKKIQSLKLSGLMAVNRGSIDKPGFVTAEWKPKNAVNKKPMVLVGKGVVYDTGGLSLKDTANSMEFMKSDMAGAATVAGTVGLIAQLKLPVHVIAVVPSTDNRPGGNAYAPGDVIKQYDGTSVEVLNTDAEGRIILADGISYAQKFDPELICTVATLTGSSLRSVGHHASVAMGNDLKSLKTLEKAGNVTRERISLAPFWDEYKEELQSDIADLKNIGGPFAGHITAGKFLEHFSRAPFMHIDTAPTSWFSKEKDYHSKGGTGIGVRLLLTFVIQKYGLENSLI